MAEQNQDMKPVQIKTGVIEMPGIDVTPYIGRKVKLASVQEFTGKFGYGVKIETGILDTIKLGKDKVVELKASKIFGLNQDEHENIGWTKDSLLAVFLKEMGVSHYNDLAGKEVIVLSTLGKDGKKYLTF